MKQSRYERFGHRYYGMSTPQLWVRLSNSPLKSPKELRKELEAAHSIDAFSLGIFNNMFKFHLISYLHENEDMIKLHLL